MALLSEDEDDADAGVAPVDSILLVSLPAQAATADANASVDTTYANVERFLTFMICSFVGSVDVSRTRVGHLLSAATSFSGIFNGVDATTSAPRESSSRLSTSKQPSIQRVLRQCFLPRHSREFPFSKPRRPLFQQR